MKFALVKKTIYSLGALREVLGAANRRDDEAIFLALARGEFTISGVQHKALRARFPHTTAAKCPESYAGFAPTGSSKRRAAATGTT